MSVLTPYYIGLVLGLGLGLWAGKHFWPGYEASKASRKEGQP